MVVEIMASFRTFSKDHKNVGFLHFLKSFYFHEILGEVLLFIIEYVGKSVLLTFRDRYLSQSMSVLNMKGLVKKSLFKSCQKVIILKTKTL